MIREWVLSMLYPECTYLWCSAPSREFQPGEEVMEVVRESLTLGLMHPACGRQHRQQQCFRINCELN